MPDDVFASLSVWGVSRACDEETVMAYQYLRDFEHFLKRFLLSSIAFESSELFLRTYLCLQLIARAIVESFSSFPIQISKNGR